MTRPLIEDYNHCDCVSRGSYSSGNDCKMVMWIVSGGDIFRSACGHALSNSRMVGCLSHSRDKVPL